MLLLLLPSACGDGEAPEPPETGPAPTPAASSSPPPRVIIDWSARPTDPVGLTDGFSVQACPGEGPFLCVARSAEPVGSIEYLSFPGSGNVLLNLVEGDYRALAEDRERTCPGFRVETEEPVIAPVGGAAGIRSQATVVDGDGVTVERYVKFWAVDDRVRVLSAEAQEPGSCSPGDGGQFRESVLTEFVPSFAAVSEGSRFPAGG
jgi:hypothetical protein